MNRSSLQRYFFEFSSSFLLVVGYWKAIELTYTIEIDYTTLLPLILSSIFLIANALSSKTPALHSNPGITIGLWTAGVLKTKHSTSILLSQIVGSAAAWLVMILTTGSLDNKQNFLWTTEPTTSSANIFLLISTFILELLITTNLAIFTLAAVKINESKTLTSASIHLNIIAIYLIAIISVSCIVSIEPQATESRHREFLLLTYMALIWIAPSAGSIIGSGIFNAISADYEDYPPDNQIS